MSDLKTHEHIAQLVPKGSRVLDLGCGDGALLALLKTQRNCSVYGIEIDDQNVLRCLERGVDVLQIDLEDGLSLFADSSFDVVLQIDTLQNLRNAEVMLRETVRVGRAGIIAFPNFAHWPNRLQVLAGRMPVTKALPYEWYDTPNIRVGTHSDFEALAQSNGLVVEQSFGLHQGKKVTWWPNMRASTAVFKLHRNWKTGATQDPISRQK
jgi:methionine biosynthesis protein MetW